MLRKVPHVREAEKLGNRFTPGGTERRKWKKKKKEEEETRNEKRGEQARNAFYRTLSIFRRLANPRTFIQTFPKSHPPTCFLSLSLFLFFFFNSIQQWCLAYVTYENTRHSAGKKPPVSGFVGRDATRYSILWKMHGPRLKPEIAAVIAFYGLQRGAYCNHETSVSKIFVTPRRHVC